MFDLQDADDGGQTEPILNPSFLCLAESPARPLNVATLVEAALDPLW